MPLHPIQYPSIKITVQNRQNLVCTHRNGMLVPATLPIIEIFQGPEPAVFSHELAYLDAGHSQHFTGLADNCPIEFSFPDENASTILPAETTSHLLTFFKKHIPRDKKNYCCINFAYEMAYGRDVIKEDNGVDFNFLPYTVNNLQYEIDLQPGQILFMFKNTPQCKFEEVHAAIYIGRSHYLSMFGTQAPLVITSLKTLQKAYAADYCVVFLDKMEKTDYHYLNHSQQSSLFRIPNKAPEPATPLAEPINDPEHDPDADRDWDWNRAFASGLW